MLNLGVEGLEVAITPSPPLLLTSALDFLWDSVTAFTTLDVYNHAVGGLEPTSFVVHIKAVCFY